jgi:hypothetical protein
LSDLHIDDFYRDAARILAALYAQFPRKSTLYVEDICGPDTPDEFGLHSPRHQACFHTMMWLGSCDYLHYEQAVRQEALDQVVLTHRGFLLLSSAMPDMPYPSISSESLPGPLPIEGSLVIHRIRQELRDGTSYSLAAVMQALMLMARNLGDVPRAV